MLFSYEYTKVEMEIANSFINQTFLAHALEYLVLTLIPLTIKFQQFYA